jgi:E3 ubiquitin-protein ligase EDD1
MLIFFLQTPLYEALPLAEQPQLLQPNARREDLFGTPRQPFAPVEEKPSSPLYVLPTR